MDAFALLDKSVQRTIYDMNWTSLRPLQEESIEYLIETPGDLIISAPTASGKTEAAFLPILSKIVQGTDSGVQALYVSPLKALINDQLRRVEQLCAHLDIPVTRWHGDASITEKKRLLKNPAGIMMTTPESLEALFQLRSTALLPLFGRLRFIVIDEIHYFLENSRGTQLRSLLNRLEKLIDRDPWRIGLSATIGNPESLKKWLNYKDPEKVKVVLGTGVRKNKSGLIEFFDKPEQDSSGDKGAGNRESAASNTVASNTVASNTVASNTVASNTSVNQSAVNQSAVNQSVENLVLNRQTTVDASSASQSPSSKPSPRDERLFKLTHTGKNLVFADSKSTLETSCWQMSQMAKEYRYPDTYFIHHGSLSREIREFAEEQLKTQKDLSVFCTSTLELGIDIGSVDQTLFLSVPYSVASFVQRLGRSGRTENGVQKFVFLLESDPVGQNLADRLNEDLVRGIALVELMKTGWCEPQDSDWLDYSTVVQQTLSCLGQTRGAAPIRLFNMVCNVGLEQKVKEDDFIALLRSLKEKELIDQQSDGIIFLAEKGERIVEDYHFFATFETPPVWKVRYKDKEIGEIEGAPLQPFAPGDAIALAGKRWQIECVRQENRILTVIPGVYNGIKPISMSEHIVHPEVHKKMRQIYETRYVPEYLSRNAKRRLDDAFEAYATIRDNPQSNYWLIFQGTRIANTLAMLLKSDKSVEQRLDFLFSCSQGRSALREKLDSLTFDTDCPESLLNCYPNASKEMRKYDFCLPVSLLNKSYYLHCMDWAGTRQFCSEPTP